MNRKDKPKLPPTGYVRNMSRGHMNDYICENESSLPEHLTLQYRSKRRAIPVQFTIWSYRVTGFCYWDRLPKHPGYFVHLGNYGKKYSNICFLSPPIAPAIHAKYTIEFSFHHAHMIRSQSGLFHRLYHIFHGTPNLPCPFQKSSANLHDVVQWLS